MDIHLHDRLCASSDCHMAPGIVPLGQNLGRGANSMGTVQRTYGRCELQLHSAFQFMTDPLGLVRLTNTLISSSSCQTAHGPCSCWSSASASALVNYRVIDPHEATARVDTRNTIGWSSGSGTAMPMAVSVPLQGSGVGELAVTKGYQMPALHLEFPR